MQCTTPDIHLFMSLGVRLNQKTTQAALVSKNHCVYKTTMKYTEEVLTSNGSLY